MSQVENASDLSLETWDLRLLKQIHRVNLDIHNS
jgi:hypothetical protein